MADRKKTPNYTQSTNNILKYCRPIDRKNHFECKSIKSRSINDDEYTVFNREDKVANSFPVVSIRDEKKKSLKFNDDSDDEQVSEKDAETPP